MHGKHKMSGGHMMKDSEMKKHIPKKGTIKGTHKGKK